LKDEHNGIKKSAIIVFIYILGDKENILQVLFDHLFDQNHI